jgi:hypothetical protein
VRKHLGEVSFELEYYTFPVSANGSIIMKNIEGFWRISLKVRRGEELVGRIFCGDMSRRVRLS